MKEIEITIDTDGKAEINLNGFHGKGCSDVIDKLIKSLGADVSKREQKQEYYKKVIENKVKQNRI